jgi:hypothetical protein
MLGYGRIYLSGVDFAFHADKARFTGYTVKKPEYTIQNSAAGEIVIQAEWEKHEHPYTPSDQEITTTNGLKTELTHLYYKKNFLSAVRLSMQEVYTTDRGAITELPYVSVENAVAGHPTKSTQSKKKKTRMMISVFFIEIARRRETAPQSKESSRHTK